MSTALAADEIRHLPPVLTVVQAAALLGIGRFLAPNLGHLRLEDLAVSHISIRGLLAFW